MAKDYWTCPYCGANLDHGENCDCMGEEREAAPVRREQPLTHHQNHTTENSLLSMEKGGGGMRILSLKLENFQGLRSAEFQLDGMSGSIYGDSATGKTTVFNAVTWLLFGSASTGAKGYTPKTDGPDGELHNLDHAAEMKIALDSGRTVTLRKVFHEVYKRKRGSTTPEFNGHTVDFYMDGMPVKEKEYIAALLEFCGGAERMKLLTMPDYFSEVLSWDQRRTLLLEICEDVTDAEIIAGNKELAELPVILRMPGTENQQYTVEEYRKGAARSRRGDSPPRRMKLRATSRWLWNTRKLRRPRLMLMGRNLDSDGD